VAEAALLALASVEELDIGFLVGECVEELVLSAGLEGAAELEVAVEVVFDCGLASACDE